MLGEIAAGLGSLKALKDIVQGLNAAGTQAAVTEMQVRLNSLILDAQHALLAANEAQAACVERVRDLEQQIVQLKDWDREKQRYQLEAVSQGAFAYTMKPGMESGEPPHWLCANCYGRGQKSFLQFKGQDLQKTGVRATTSTYGCDVCKSTIKVHYTRHPSEPS